MRRILRGSSEILLACRVVTPARGGNASTFLPDGAARDLLIPQCKASEMGRGAIMRRHSTAGIVLALGCAWLLGTTVVAAASPPQQSTDRAAVLQTFNGALQQYATLRARFEEPLPPLDPRRGEWSLRVQRYYLASAIRNARHRAAQGDIFSPSVATMLRQDIANAISTNDIEGLVDENMDAHLVDLAVNEPVPVWAMRPAPNELLRFLPLLVPDGIEYRLVGGSLILWDTHAEILIDALPNALTWDD
jgi:hypothetical protein